MATESEDCHSTQECLDYRCSPRPCDPAPSANGRFHLSFCPPTVPRNASGFGGGGGGGFVGCAGSYRCDQPVRM